MHKLIILLLSLSALNSQAQIGIVPPKAKEKPKKTKLHDKEMIDEFAWLRDIQNPEVVAHLNAENEHTDAIMFGTLDLQKKLKEEMLLITPQERKSLPYLSNDYYYFSERKKGEEFFSWYRQPKDTTQEAKLLIDVNALSKNYPYFRLMNFKVSPDNNWLAYMADTLGNNEGVLFIRNIRGKDILKVPARVGDMEWMSNSRDIIYTIRNDVWRVDKVVVQNINTLQNVFKIILEEKDERYDLRIRKSISGAFIFIESSSFSSNEYHYVDAAAPNVKTTLFRKRQDKLIYHLHHHPDKGFVVHHNEGRSNFKVAIHPVAPYKAENLIDIHIPVNQVFVYKIEAFRDHIALYEKFDARKSVRLINYVGLEKAEMRPDGTAGNVEGENNFEFNAQSYRYQINSFLRPLSIFDYDLVASKHILKDREPTPGFDPKQYREEVIYATARDGEVIPVSLFYKEGVQQNGQNPCLLYGYGAYGYGTYSYFNPYLLNLIDRGFILAVAHVRGGDEKGYDWYLQGKMKQKMNSFTDFIAVAEHLIGNLYTSPSRLIAKGGSAGGLLMGAVVNMRPDLFRAVVLNVPFVDVINTMLDETLPLSTGEFLQWGNPKVKEDFDYMIQYSPYDNVKKQKYPLMLFTTGIMDKQVGYWEPTKMVARLRKLNPEGLPVLLRCEMKSGHSGGSALTKRIMERAFEHAFILSSVGINE